MNVNELILSEVREMKADLGREIGEVKTLARATNGRVTKLERIVSYAKGATATLVGVATFLAGTGHLHFS